MRRTSRFCMPTLLLSLVIQIIGAFSLWLPYLPIASQALAADPITPSGFNTHVSGAIVTGSGPTQSAQYDITGGTRPGGTTGTNLFHSFGDFNVPTKNIANFLNAGSVDLAGNPLAAGLPTTNILGTVTGVDPSIIFGTIQTNGTGGFGNANLFLMNPNGIIFGPTASLNVGGIATFTTANYLRLTDTGIFYADPAATNVLTSTPVAAFGFLGSNPAAISVQGSTLALQPGQSISLVGGNQGFTYTNPNTDASASVPNGVTVVTGGHLLAPAGQVNIVSVASPGEVMARTFEYAPNVNGQSFGALGTIQVSQQSSIDVSGNGGGTVLIRGGQFLLDSSTISANTTGPGHVTNGAESIGGGIDIVVSQDAKIQNLAVLETNVTGNATPGVTHGSVHVKADRIEILGTVTLEDLFSGRGDPSAFTGIRSNVSPGSTGGNSGAITLEANSILIKDFAKILTITDGAGNAGNILVKVNQNIDIDFGQIVSGQSGMSLAQPATGDAGSIELTSSHGNISLTNLSPIVSQTAESPGTAGTITLSAASGNILLGDGTRLSTQIAPPINPTTGVRTVRAGGSGGILINTNNLEVIGTDIGVTNNSTLPSGDVTVNLSGSLTLHSGSFGPSLIHALAQGPAPSAGLTIAAHDILITDGGSLTTSTVSSGAAGPLNISVVNLQLTNGGQISSESRQGIDPGTRLPGGPPPTGPGGTVSIQGKNGPAQAVLIDGQDSGIFTTAAGTGDGGTINLSAQSLTMTDRATITASSTGTVPNPGNAGDISINAGQRLEMRDSSITTQATQASGGNINIQAVDHIRLVNSVVSSSVADGPGGGGNISIDPQVVALQDSKILAQAADGQGGAIKIITSLFLRDANSKVNADAGSSGLNGTVTIQSPTSNLSESLGTLPSEPSQTHSLLTQRCAALVNGQTSSFVVAGREQLPVDPGGWLTSPLAFAALGGSLDAGHTIASTPAVMAMATDDTGTVSIRRLTPAGFLMANFAESEATGCRS